MDDLKEQAEQLHAMGMSDDDIAETSFLMFAEGKMSKGELMAMLEAIGAELSPKLAELNEDELRAKINQDLSE